MEIFPSSVIFGVTSKLNKASLKETVAGEVPDAGVVYGTSAPCLIIALMPSIVTILGEEINFPVPLVSKAASWVSRKPVAPPNTRPMAGDAKVDGKFTAAVEIIPAVGVDVATLVLYT